jgi:hypothetical protein
MSTVSVMSVMYVCRWGQRCRVRSCAVSPPSVLRRMLRSRPRERRTGDELAHALGRVF